jgi:RNA polymerase sigma factor (sigma-70 family)
MGEMQPQSDAHLLRAYAERGTEAAFAEIVARHTDLVYSAALRQLYSPDLARDVTQSVFTDLARKAREVSFKLSTEASLVGWLYRGTRFAARDLYRNETRRTQRERQAMAQLYPTPETPPDWEQLRPALDDAMAELDELDRDAVLLRYFKNYDLRTVGTNLGISDDAAQKRVSRAVERLREFFAKRGVTVGASGLAVVISANAVQAAPVGLAVTISTAAVLTGTTLATTATVTATKAIAMTALQKTIVTATIAVLAGAGIYEARQAAQLREQVLTFRQQQAPLTEQIMQLQRERDDATNQAAALRDDTERLNRNTGELLRLRGEVGVLRNQLAVQANSSVATNNTKPGRLSTEAVSRILTPESLKDVGLATPEQTLQTMFWAWRLNDDSNLHETGTQRLRELTMIPPNYDPKILTWPTGGGKFTRSSVRRSEVHPD